MKKYLFLLLFAVLSAIFPLSLSAQSGYDNGHRYIDLGLPSGIKWAECNVGASSKTDYGDYYAWGETSTKSNYSSDTYTVYKGDVAEVKWGGSWCVPLEDDFLELRKYTTNEWTTINGVNGWLFTAKNGNSIFLPAAGYRSGTSLDGTGSDGNYWSRTLNADNSGGAYYLDFDSDDLTIWDDGYRPCGFTVRPVCLLKQKESPPQDMPDVPSKKGTDNDYTYVDLGLPSGTKWADRNVGASSSTDYGYYLSWGETASKSNYDWSTYKYGPSYDNLTKYCTYADYGKNSFTDNKTELDLSDDVARQQWGASWHMPSNEQFDELRNYTTNEWTTINGVNGTLFKGKNGNSIFLPAAGYRNGTSLNGADSYGFYWSRMLSANRPYYAYYLNLGSSDVDVDHNLGYRRYGFTVRPVRLPKQEETPPQDTPKTPSNSGTDNGHTYVDLGLPSGTKWAECNIGASSKTDYGDYYAWGEMSTKSNYDRSTYKYGTNYNNLTKYCTKSDYGKNSFTDNKTELDLSDDVARQQWGGSWRVPSKEQFDELLKYTTDVWTTINGVDGRLFTAKNGNSIFLPAAGLRDGSSLDFAGSNGYYWSRTLYADGPDNACHLYFHWGYVNVNYGSGYGSYIRCHGLIVRPVRP